MTPTTASSESLVQTPFDRAALDRLPPAESLASDPISVDPGDPDWAPPALTNQWAGLVAGRDVFSYAGLSTPVLYSHSVHGRLYAGLAGSPLRDLSKEGPITYRWYPSRLERRQLWKGLSLEATTLIPPDGATVVNILEVANPGPEAVTVNLFVTITADTSASWDTSWPPADTVTAATSFDRSNLILRDRHSQVTSVLGSDLEPLGVAGFGRQGANSGSAPGLESVSNRLAPVDPLAPAEEPSGTRWIRSLEGAALDGEGLDDPRIVALHYRLVVPAGESVKFRWVHALAENESDAHDHFRRFLGADRALIDEVRDAWEEEWRAAFDREADRFSGYLPVLESSQESVRRLYYMGVLTLLYCKRTPEWGSKTHTYVTGFPSSIGTFPHTWVFPWDAMMVSGVLSQLDPAVMRAMITAWLEADMHQGCAIDFRTGRPVGYWYAVNDYALIHMTWQYVRYSGDLAFLHTPVRGRVVLDHLLDCARYYLRLADSDGLADYGTAENLLECVSSYTHKVASFNAANVWTGRTVAAMLGHAGRDEEARELLERASRLVEAVRSLYQDGQGYWACKQPDGTLVPVRHCLDFFTVLQCMPDELSERQVEEMVAFFQRELKTTTWMHALSPLDPDCAFSSRTDHQDEGAYTTWPAYCLEVLLQTGHEREALTWIGLDGERGLADVTRQGPFGQAYSHGDAGSPSIGGAGAKAPMEFPHIEKPVLVAGGKYAQVVIEALAGLQPQLNGDPTVVARRLPIEVRLSNLLLRGGNFRLELTGN